MGEAQELHDWSNRRFQHSMVCICGINFNSVVLDLYSAKSQLQLPLGALYCKVEKTQIIKKPSKHLVTVGSKKNPF